MTRIAKSLDLLRSEVNARWPNRSTASDGWIGDAAHRASASDHNPNAADVVCAFDLTHDPDNGVDCHVISEHIRTHRPPALKYIIFNGRICSAKGEWVWRPNRGHEHHMHVSVGVGPDGQSTGPYDDTTPWLEHLDEQPEDDLTPDDRAQLDNVRKDVTTAIKEGRDLRVDVTALHIKMDQTIAKLDELLSK